MVKHTDLKSASSLQLLFLLDSIKHLEHNSDSLLANVTETVQTNPKGNVLRIKKPHFQRYL